MYFETRHAIIVSGFYYVYGIGNLVSESLVDRLIGLGT